MIDDISKWEALQLRYNEGDPEDVFIEFANMCSKHFMEQEPEQWHRFCDGEYTETNFHKEWLDLILNNDKIAIECAREHLKTSFVLNYILYRLFRHDNFSVIYFCAKHDQSKSKLEELEEIYNRNKHWLDIEPSKERWSRNHKQFDNGSDIRSEGWGTAVEGAHVQLIIMDDILQEAGTGSMTDKEIWQFYARVVDPMVTESGKVILIGTKKRDGDIFDKVDKNPAWVHRKYPSTPDNVIFPEKWPKDRLVDKKQAMTARHFNREFGLQVIVSEDVLINPDWNDRNTDDSLSYPKEGWKQGLNVLGLDPAISPTGDHAAFFSMSRRPETGERFILDVQRHQGMSLNRMLEKLTQLDIKYNYQSIMIEKNSFQRLIVENAIERTDLPIQGHETTKTKSDPSEGLPRIAVLFENGKYIYPYKNHEDVNQTDEIFTALNSVQYDQGKLRNDHTPDLVMSKYMAEMALRQWENTSRGIDEPLVRGVKGRL